MEGNNIYYKDNSFLTKHGSGRLMPGLDEGIHGMRKGGRRRVIIPPKLGYAVGNVGPVPPNPLVRRSLNKLLDRMVEERGGRFVFDVELLDINSDEGDVGYYSDNTISSEDFNKLRDNMKGMGGGKSSAAATAKATESIENVEGAVLQPGEGTVLQPDRRN